MPRSRLYWVIFFSFIFLYINSIQSQTKTDKFQPDSKSTYEPYYLDFRVHKNGRFWNTVISNGILGNYFKYHDPGIQLTAPNHYYPRYMRIRHGFFTALWVGGIIGDDTLVTTAIDVEEPAIGDYGYSSEFWPDLNTFYYEGGFEETETSFDNNLNQLAESEVKFVSTFNDTLTDFWYIDYNPHDMRYHRPLNIEVTQTSYSWSYDYAEDFIIINYKIKNIGDSDIKNGYVGFYHLGANHYTYELPYILLDDIPGYIDSIPAEFEEIGYEQMDIAWTIDVDGWPVGNSWQKDWSTRNVLGLAPLDLPPTAYVKNFNWWFNGYGRSWGPRKRATAAGDVRMFSGDFGQPLDDKSKYYMMSHPEQDYNGYYASVNMSYFNWIPPFEYADDISNGFLVHYLQSFGPFDIPKGGGVELTIVNSIGENVHNVPYAYREYFDPQKPQNYMPYLDFSDLINNIRWAKRIYDNPGVDTDFDGDSGKYFFMVDTVTYDSTQIFYTGDGVPDFKGASPPPPPVVRAYPSEGKITLRWNGRFCENFYDSFSNTRDFEGYQVYLARSLDENDIVLMSSYDQENFNRYKWNNKYNRYDLLETPFTLDSLKAIYGADFDPLAYTRVDPLFDNGRYYYFSEVGNNTSDLLDPAQIHKVYPNAIIDTADVDEEGRMRYYEYEYVIENLLPTVPYFVSVTAFDFGLPSKSLGSLESSPYQNQIEVFAVDTYDNSSEPEELNVYCYPNPYRIDSEYDKNGFENRFTDLYSERARNLYFANLPKKCSISIFSLDGDLIKKIDHNEEFGSGTISIERFDLIGRNDMAITTGLYYWVVESEFGNQIGKLVVIK